MTLLRRLVAALALLLIAVPALAAPTFPKLTGRVVDEARLLSPQQASELEGRLAALEQRSGRQLVVATVTDLQGYDIQDYGYQLGRHWAIGDAKRDDGVILLVAPNERKVGIQTGYGAGVYVTDALSSLIINRTILPKFKAGDMPGGIIAGAEELATLMELPPEEAARRNQEAAAGARANTVDVDGSAIVFFFILFFFFIVPLLRSAARGRRYRGKRRGDGGIDPWVVLWGLDALSRASRGRGGGWGGGGGFGGGFGGGGGFSGGGGSFGGGGASGSW